MVPNYTKKVILTSILYVTLIAHWKMAAVVVVVVVVVS
jgi:hypothetical protein